MSFKRLTLGDPAVYVEVGAGLMTFSTPGGCGHFFLDEKTAAAVQKFVEENGDKDPVGMNPEQNEIEILRHNGQVLSDLLSQAQADRDRWKSLAVEACGLLARWQIANLGWGEVCSILSKFQEANGE